MTCNLSWLTLLKDGTEFNDQSSIIFNLWDKYHNSTKDFNQVNDLCQSYIQIKQSLHTTKTLEDLEEICKQHGSHKWVEEFIKNIANYTTDSKSSELDFNKAHANLTACFDRSFWNSIGIQMLFYSLHALFQSYRAWNLINSFHLPSYENQLTRLREKLDECSFMCTPLLELQTLTNEQVRRLQRIQELLRDVKDSLQFIFDDIKNKLIQAQKYRSNSYISAFMNFLSTILNAVLWQKISTASGEHSRSSLTTGASTIIQATSTLGDIVHARKAADFIVTLEDTIEIIKDLEVRQRRLSIQINAKLTEIF